MRKSWLAAGLGAMLMTGLIAGSVIADDDYTIMLGDQRLETLVPVQMINERIMAPVRDIAEALGAKVTWDGSTHTVHLDFSMDKHIALLEQALAVNDPLDAAYRFADGVRAGNGAAQYALMTPEFRDATAHIMNALHWETGQHGPALDNYAIMGSENQGNDQVKITIQLVHVDQQDIETKTVTSMIVNKIDEHWYVASFGEEDDYLLAEKNALLEAGLLEEELVLTE